MVPVRLSAVAGAEGWSDMSKPIKAPTEPGKFVGLGPLAFGVHRDGTPGVMFHGHFFAWPDSMSSGDKEDKPTAKPIKDINLPLSDKGPEKRSASEAYKPKVGSRLSKDMRSGGMVRGCGSAQRGLTRGKIK